MSRSFRPCTPPPALTSLNAASMPNFIRPSSLAAPLNGAEIPNRISVSVTPRTAVLAPPGSCPSDACCAGALADGSALEPTPIVVAGTSALFAGALLAVSRSDGLTACDVCEFALSSAPEPCHSGLAKMVTSTTRVVNETHGYNPAH